MLGNRRVKYLSKGILKYIYVGRAFMPGNRRVKYLFNVYCEIY
jgi:hypothetical protein